MKMRTFIIVILVTLLFNLSSTDSGHYIKCTEFPQLTIKITTSKGTSESNGTEVLISEPASIEIICLSSSPLQMDFKGEMVHRFDDIVATRYTPYYKNGSHGDCFEVVLSLKSKVSATGNYTCETITRNTETVISAYIYADTENTPSGHLLNAGHCISTGREVPDNFSLIIPCIVSNKRSRPKLYRSNYGNCADIRKNIDETMEQKTFPYDPQRGFIIDTRNTSDCWTNFVCVLGDQSLGVHTIEPKGFRAIPAEGTVIYNQTPQSPTSLITNYNAPYSKKTFICESTDNITFTHTIRDENQKSIEIKNFKRQPEKYYSYKSRLRYSGTFAYAANTSTVSCVSTKNSKTVYWTWTIVHKGHKDKTGLFFDDKKESYFCYSATARPIIPNLTLIDCDNSLDCKIAQSFIENNSTDLKNFPFKVSDVGYPCRNQPSTIYSGCKEFPIQIGKHYGMAHCQTGDYHYFSIYYTNLLGHIVTHLSERHNGQDIILDKINRTLYVNETVTFRCKASPLQFSLGIRIAVQFLERNSSLSPIYDYDFPENATFKAKEQKIGNRVIVFAVTMKIWTNRIKGFICEVPVLFTNGWKSVVQTVMVEEGKYPEIEKAENISQLMKVNENRTLTCTASGVPLPIITWARENFQIQPDVTQFTETYNNMTVSTIVFPKLSAIIPGEYFCIATNAKGSSRKAFTVEIAKLSFFTYSIIAGTVAAIFVILLLILIGILRRQKRAIENLTEAEIVEFENGNATMVHHSSELNEIAQYLPYNLDFEIPEKQLELIDEDLLGSGAFGVVLKGYVEKNGEKYAVAIKTIKASNNVEQLKKLLVELKIMMHIGRHVNIIYLIGAQTRKLREGKVRVIVEYCAIGNLQTFLRENRGDFVNQVVNDQIDEWIMPRTKNTKQNRNAITKLPDAPIVYETKRFSQQSPSIRTLDLVNWCYQLANGMEYLAMKKVIHGDLATRNLLLTEDWTLKITDFGLSRHMYEYTNYIRKEKVEPLPWRWLSIEAIRDSKFSTMSDVWAFGITIWEIFSLAEVPYPGFSWGEEFVRALSKGYRMSKPYCATTDLYNTMQECWRQELTDRPTFKVLTEYFQQILETYSNSNEKILEAFLGPEPFNFESKSVQTTEDLLTP